MKNAVECECGHIVWTSKDKFQCYKCHKRYATNAFRVSVPSILKNQKIEQLKEKIQSQEKTIQKLLKFIEKQRNEEENILKELQI